MPERFTGDARQVVVRASEQARRLGHGFIGGEHLLYGLASAGGEVGAVLRERGVTPERVEAEFVRLTLTVVNQHGQPVASGYATALVDGLVGEVPGRH